MRQVSEGVSCKRTSSHETVCVPAVSMSAKPIQPKHSEVIGWW